MKIKLSNGCFHSHISVNPKNWDSKNANVSKDWYISYRFYDPQFLKPKQVMLKGMNVFKLLQDRQVETRKLIDAELNSLQDGYNPFYKVQSTSILDSKQGMTLIDCLTFAFENGTFSERTKQDLHYSINRIIKSINSLGLQQLNITSISRKHIKLILDNTSTTADSFNKNRSNLMMLFSVLSELEIVPTNFIRDIKKKKVLKKIRQTLTLKEREQVSNHLKGNYPSFYNFLNIFFHSGARISELMKVRTTDVDLHNQRFKVIIKKGVQYQEVWKTIKGIAIQYWVLALEGAEKGDYIFSKGLKPGKEPIRSFQIGKRWYRLVKLKLNITADFYSLKHLHTTEVVEMLNEVEAAKHNSHTSTSMVKNIYDVNNKTRKESNVRDLKNGFI